MTKRTPLIDKYQANVVVTDGCWDWTGPINEHGYAILYVPVEDAPQRRWTPSRAHRFAFETFVGPPRRVDPRPCVPYGGSPAGRMCGR